MLSASTARSPFTQAFAGLPQEFEGVGGGALRGSAIRISAVLLDEVRLKCGSDFVCRLQRMVDGPVPCGVVNHAASILRSLLRNTIRGHPARLSRQTPGCGPERQAVARSHQTRPLLPPRARVVGLGWGW